MIKDINYLVLSDIHLGHPRNKTATIIEHLEVYFKDNEKLFSKLDIIFIAGDLYDRLLQHSSDDSLLAIAWLSKLAAFCSKFKIKLRILEGTPSHDWHQVKVFDKALHKLNLDVDFKYIETLYIEHIEDLQLTVLYVPDEWRPESSETYKEVLELLSENNLDKVDIAIMHGMFRYQLPNGIEMDCFEEKDFLDITRYFINIGHIHTSSVNNRILAQGSFDRLNHGEEERKGGMLVFISEDKDCSFRFIENKNATLFLTKIIKIKNIDKALEIVDRFLRGLEKYSHVLLKFTRDNPLNTVMNDIKKKYPFFRITKKNIDEIGNEDDDTSLKKALSNKKIDIVPITKNNITELLMKELKTELVSDEDLQLAINELKEVV